MDSEKELYNYMKKKTMSAMGEKDVENNDNNNEIEVTERNKPINQEQTGEDLRAARAMAKLRFILNIICMIPIILSVIGLIAYSLINILPTTLAFIKNFIFLIMSQ